jgi:hypothetical protein
VIARLRQRRRSVCGGNRRNQQHERQLDHVRNGLRRRERKHPRQRRLFDNRRLYDDHGLYDNRRRYNIDAAAIESRHVIECHPGLDPPNSK